MHPVPFHHHKATLFLPSITGRHHERILQARVAGGDDPAKSLLLQTSDARITMSRQALYYKRRLWHNEEFGGIDVQSQLASLRRLADELRSSGVRIVVKEMHHPTEGHLYAVGWVTALCDRVHCLFASSLAAFVDHVRGVDADMHYLVVAAVLTPFGSLPAGFAACNRKSQACLELAFLAMREAMGPNRFGGRQVPQVVMTDDEPAEFQAFQAVFTGVIHLLCFFHVLEAMWKWLTDSKHHIAPDDRQPLFEGFRAMVLAPTEPECLLARDTLLTPRVCAQYPAFEGHVHEIYARRSKICFAFRKDLKCLRGQNTNNLAEILIRIVRREVLKRRRAYNLVALVKAVALGIDSYFTSRCVVCMLTSSLVLYEPAYPVLFIKHGHVFSVYVQIHMPGYERCPWASGTPPGDPCGGCASLQTGCDGPKMWSGVKVALQTTRQE